MMFSIREVVTVSIGVFFTLTIPSVAIASSQKIIVKDGKTYTVNPSSNSSSFNVVCENMTANMMVQKPGDAPVNLMATIVVQLGYKKKAFRVFDVAKDELTTEHDISSMEVGCLTQHAGIGISMPHNAVSENDLKIQIDARGRVFLNYDEASLELISSQEK